MSNHEYFHDFHDFLEVVKLMIFHTNGNCEKFSFSFSCMMTCQVQNFKKLDDRHQLFSDIQQAMLNSVLENDFSPSVKQCGEGPDHLTLDF